MAPEDRSLPRLWRYQGKKSFVGLMTFVRRNLGEIGKLNGPILRRKFATFTRFHLRNLIEFVLMSPVSFMAAVAMRILRPLVVIRFASINASRVGHLSFDPEMALAEIECGIGTGGQRVFDIWYVWQGPFKVSNEFLLRMWKRSLRMGPRVLCHRIDQMSRFFPAGDIHVVPIRKGIAGVLDHQSGDVHGCLPRTKPHIWFEDSEEKMAWKELEPHGINRGTKFVCLLVRDADYQRTLMSDGFEEHNFRNSDVSTYREMIERLWERGYYTFRMGAVPGAPLSLECPGFIDYSSNGMRNELLDIFLSAHCSFFVTTSTGLDGVARVFRRPHVKTNHTQIETLQLSMPGLSILKTFILEDEDRPLRMSEVFERDLHRIKDGDVLLRQGVRMRSNSPHEIASVALEMCERQAGTWKPAPDEERLHEAFLEILPDYLKQGPALGRLGYEFMRSNEWLFQ